MRHLRLPVTWGHEEAGNFGLLYIWQAQPNGAVGTRLHVLDSTQWPYQWEWADAQGHDALAKGCEVPLEEDVALIMNDFYPHLRKFGSLATKVGTSWEVVKA
jgi:hypothetical protein